MNKRLLISTPYYLPNVSGITIYIKVLAEELVKRGFEVTILTSRHLSNSKKEEIINGVIIKRMWAPIKIGKGLIMPWFPLISIKEVVGADIINCHLPSLESFFMALEKFIFNKRLIVTYHCDFDSGNKIINKLINVAQYLVLRLADVIVVNTNDYIENYSLLKNYRKKIIEIYPPTIVEKVDSKEQSQVDQKLNKFKNKKIIGFLGRVSKEKNLELLFKAISLIKNDEFHFIVAMVGPDRVVGENEYQKNINNLFKKYKNTVLRLGEIKNVSAFLKRCDCLVIPSNNKLESFGIVQIEAIKNGVPCISSNLPGIREVIMKTKMGELFEPNNVNDFSNKIIEVLKNGKNFYKKRAKNLELFDFKKSVDKYQKLFES